MDRSEGVRPVAHHGSQPGELEAAKCCFGPSAGGRVVRADTGGSKRAKATPSEGPSPPDVAGSPEAVAGDRLTKRQPLRRPHLGPLAHLAAAGPSFPSAPSG